MKILFLIIICHLMGDYVLQSDFIAQTKGENWYHLLVHCSLYVVPFYVIFGFDWKLLLLFITHIIIDPLKARWNKINYATDQVFHYVVAILLYAIL